MRININNKDFESKKEAKNYIKKNMYDILKKIDKEYPYFHIYRDEFLFDFLEDLILNNKEKNIQKKILYFGVMKNPLNIKSFHTYIKFTDESYDDISFFRCIDNYKKDVIYKNDYTVLSNCMRKIIRDQIFEFRQEKIQNKKFVCEMCPNIEKIEIDHIKTFKVLVDEFLEKNTYKYNIVDDLILGGEKIDDKNICFINSWYDFHEENANLRCLCQSCNLKRNKK